jgi:hypothetical protein
VVDSFDAYLVGFSNPHLEGDTMKSIFMHGGAMMEDKITVNGKEYVLASTVKNSPRLSLGNKKYVMVRTYSAGVFAGYLKSRKGKEVVLNDARRIYYWDGAASLSQLATEGTSKPQNCKFPVAVDEVLLTEAIEIIPITEKARESIASVKVWSQ